MRTPSYSKEGCGQVRVRESVRRHSQLMWVSENVRWDTYPVATGDGLVSTSLSEAGLPNLSLNALPRGDTPGLGPPLGCLVMPSSRLRVAATLCRSSAAVVLALFLMELLMERLKFCTLLMLAIPSACTVVCMNTIILV